MEGNLIVHVIIARSRVQLQLYISKKLSPPPNRFKKEFPAYRTHLESDYGANISTNFSLDLPIQIMTIVVMLIQQIGNCSDESWMDDREVLGST